MRQEIRQLLDASDGVVTRAELARVVPHHVIDRALGGGALVRVFPRTYAEPHSVHDVELRVRAALRYAGDSAAVSSLTALSRYDLPVPAHADVHVTVDSGARVRGAPGLVVHHRRGFRPEAPQVHQRDGVPAVRLEHCLTEAWAMLPAADRRAPVILAVQRRLTTAERVLAAAEELPKLRHRVELLSLLRLLAKGCHSELEIWGYLQVFARPPLPAAVRQLRVRLGQRSVYLDVAFPDERLNVELDGSAYHAGPRQRELDLRRDCALGALGWQTVRYSHARLRSESEDARREVLSILQVRRRQLGLAAGPLPRRTH